ncbi:hypothetical protein BSP10_096 [Bacillus phage BSP10]|nr:hypothetical protein BSP10_096 [Bacillus phage BSP10]QRI44669.1 CoA ligase [Bacillus phage BSTP3]
MKAVKITTVQGTKNRPSFLIEDTVYEEQKQRVATASEVIDRLNKEVKS